MDAKSHDKETSVCSYNPCQFDCLLYLRQDWIWNRLHSGPGTERQIRSTVYKGHGSVVGDMRFIQAAVEDTCILSYFPHQDRFDPCDCCGTR